MKFKSNFKVIAPAVVSDLGCGLDVFGLAIDGLYDEVLVKPSNQAGIHIADIVGNKTNIPLEAAQNAAGVAALHTLAHLQEEHGLDSALGLTLTLRKRVPVGHGLGSSAASAVAGAMAVNEAFGRLLDKRALLPFALKGEAAVEGRPRINAIVPAMLGSCILAQSVAPLQFYRLPLIRGLQVVVVYPRNIRLFQQERSTLLPAKLPTSLLNQQTAASAALVQAFYTGNLDGIKAALSNNPLEAFWSNAVPLFDDLKAAALDKGALACSLAGKGSGVFALCKNNLDAENVGEELESIYETARIRCTVVRSSIDHEGATLA